MNCNKRTGLNDEKIPVFLLLCFVTFKELQKKLASFETAAQAFKAGDFLNIFLRFWGF